MNLITWMGIGAVIGAFWYSFFPHLKKGRLADAALGTLGALEAGYLYSLLSVTSYEVVSYFVAILGACGFLLIQRLFVNVGEA